MTDSRPWGHVFQPPGRPGWYVAFTAEGRKIRRAAGRTEKVARKRLEKVQQYLEDGARLDDVLAHVFGDFNGARLTVREAAALFLDYLKVRRKESTLRTHAQRLALILRAPWTAKILGRVEPGDLQRWLAERQQPRPAPAAAGGVAPAAGETSKRVTTGATLNRDLSLLSALYRWAIGAGYCRENPARGVERFNERGRAREVYLTGAEVRALLDACSPSLRPIATMAVHTGARQGELRGLEWRDVDLERRTMLVRPEVEKSGRGRQVRLAADVVAMLEELRGRRSRPRLDGTDRVFLSQRGKPWSRSGLQVAFQQAVRRCEGIEGSKRGSVTFHTMRHTAASLMAGAGVTLFEVGTVLGHRDPRTTQRYAHASPETGRAAIDALASVLAGPGRASGRA